jgi:uncharacterized protein with GYD domain
MTASLSNCQVVTLYLIKWTEQGISKINESADRYNSFKTSLEKASGKLIGGYYTFGEYDVIIIIEAPNDETVMSLMLKVGSIFSKTIVTSSTCSIELFPFASLSLV